MDDDAPPPPVAFETALRRSKRTRVPTQPVRSEPSNGTSNSDENPKRSSDAIDGSPNQEVQETSPDDFEEIRPKPKRNKISEGAPSAEYKPDSNLIEVIRGEGKQIPQSVVYWIERYKKDSKSAIAELLSMVFAACGSKYLLKKEFLDQTDVDDAVIALVNLAKIEHMDDYPGSKNNQFKNFEKNLVSFWDNLVIECQNNALLDEVLFHKCIDYIIALSRTPPREFRLIASLIGLQLVTSFISIAKKLVVRRGRTSKTQLNAIQNTICKIHKGLFMHRYRDVDPTIRKTCIQSLGVWILSYPAFFLENEYLKYLGWSLNDKNAGVRKASILALQNLFQVDRSVPNLRVFAERFSKRMIELVDDIDVSVAVSAVGLVKQLLLRPKLLSDEDKAPLYDDLLIDNLLIDDRPEIRHAIGGFLYDHLIAKKFKGTKGRNDSESFLGDMLLILREFSADPILSVYVIDGVWEYMKAMKDWKCIVTILLDKNPLIEPTDEDDTNLIRLLFASVRKAVGEKIVPASDNRKQFSTKAQKEEFESNRWDITVAMMKNYPLLLRKFIADKAKIQSLVEIILYLNLELYSLKKQEQNFKDVIELIKYGFFIHGEKDVLRYCVKAMKFCSVHSRGALQDFACTKLKDLEDELIANLNSAIKQVMNGDQDGNSLFLVNLKRLYELQLALPVSKRSLYDDIVSILRNQRNHLDNDVISFLLLNMYLQVVWSLHSIINGETVTESSISSLKSKRDTLLEELDYFLNPETKLGNQLGSRVCTILADTWCLFQKKILSSTKLERLGYCPDIPVLQKFWVLCEHQLNISDGEMDAEYVEETNRDTVLISAAKLIANDVIPKEYLAPDIASHFVIHSTSEADIIKHLIAALKKKDDGVYQAFVEALQKALHRYQVQEKYAKKEGTGVRCRGRPKKRHNNIQGKKGPLDEKSSSSTSDHEIDDEEAPLINFLDSARLRSSRARGVHKNKTDNDSNQ